MDLDAGWRVRNPGEWSSNPEVCIPSSFSRPPMAGLVLGEFSMTAAFDGLDVDSPSVKIIYGFK